MGHVTSISEPRVEEGDCRFLAREILQEVWLGVVRCSVLFWVCECGRYVVVFFLSELHSTFQRRCLLSGADSVSGCEFVCTLGLRQIC